MVKSTDTCVLARHVADMLADMLATRPKMVLAEVLTMSSRHVAYGYVGNMLARLGIPIFGSDFWDPHWRRNSDYVYDSKDSGRIFF